MSTIVLDQSLAEKLRQCKEMTVLRDANGKVVGYFEPPEVHVYEAGEDPELDWAELRQRVGSSEKLTTDEVLRRLRSRP
jgi:hypothetical protein